MITIKPFRGFLPPADLAKDFSSPPYDVLSSKEARYYVENNKNSFLRVIKPESDFDPNFKIDSHSIHRQAALNLQDFIRTGKLLQDQDPQLYIYQISIDEHIQTGIISEISIDDYNRGFIKKHENTRPDKEDDRTNHIKITNANTGPVFLTFKNDGGYKNKILNLIQKKPDIFFQAEDNTIHKIWRIISSEKIADIISYFHSIPALYIADGHHRAASAARVQKIREMHNPNHSGNEAYNFFMGVVFPHDEVQILSYNRIIKDLGGLTNNEFLSRIQKKFNMRLLKKRRLPTNKNTFTMYYKKKWYELSINEENIPKDLVLGLDASILQNHLFDPVLGIKDPRTDNRIDFVGGIRGLKELERRCKIDSELAFALHPVSINQLLKVADKYKVMPPKSTWFEPKLRSGLVVRLLN